MTSSWFLFTRLKIGVMHTRAKKLKTEDTTRNVTSIPFYSSLSSYVYNSADSVTIM